MLKDFQIKGLEKIVNSSAIMDIYPMVDHIEIRHEDTGASGFGMDLDRIDVDIFLNDSNITSDNMYDMELDPHYLIEKYLKQYLSDNHKIIITAPRKLFNMQDKYT